MQKKQTVIATITAEQFFNNILKLKTAQQVLAMPLPSARLQRRSITKNKLEQLKAYNTATVQQ